MFSNTFAGIAPSSAPAYIVAQVLGGIAAIIAVRALYPDVTPEDAATVLLPHQTAERDDAAAQRS
jgi:arsenate reductase